MKKLTSILLFGAIVFFASCKKSATPTPCTTSYKHNNCPNLFFVIYRWWSKNIYAKSDHSTGIDFIPGQRKH